MKNSGLQSYKIYIVGFLLMFSILSCFKSKTEIELLENSINSVGYFYNMIIKQQKYDLLDDFVTRDIELMFGNKKGSGFWEYEGDVVGFKKKIKILHEGYGALKKYTILSNRYFDAGDYGIHNIEITVKAEYERVIVIEKLIFGYSYRKKQSVQDIKLIAYSSWKE